MVEETRMQTEPIAVISDCTTFRQVLQARTPVMVHGTLSLLVVLLASALSWGGLTRASLVVRGQGRVRPVTVPVQVRSAASGESLSASVGGRVVAVCVREGDVVHQGDVLVQLEAHRLDNQIVKERQLIGACEAEVAKLERLADLQSRQFEAARSKAEAELTQATDQVRWAGEKQDSDIRLAQIAVENAERDLDAARTLFLKKAASPVDLTRAGARASEAREQLIQARMPLDRARIDVLRRAMELAARDDAVRRLELELKRESKRAELAAQRVALANLELERRQAAIRAPMDGIVTRRDVEPGAILDPGKPVLEIARQDGFRFEAEIPSEDVGHLRAGMPARIKLDAFDFQTYGSLDGQVCFISPDSGVSGQRKGAVYTVKIALTGAEVRRGTRVGRVKLGMAGQAEIITRRESLLFLLVKKLRTSISLG
jgi:multidrug resistance efflux pump